MLFRSNTGPEFEGECRAAGMIACLRKPIDLGALRQCLASLAGANALQPPAIGDDPLARMLEDVGPDAFARLAASCGKDIAAELDALFAAWRRLPDTSGAEAVYRAAHKLASLAATIGASELARLSRELEQGRETDRATYETLAREALASLNKRVEELMARAA